MATNSSKTCDYYLPREMMLCVLSYLPVISLLRCKAVCKSWLSIIRDPQFVEAHLSNSKNKQTSVLKTSYNWRLLSIDTLEKSVKLELPSHENVHFTRHCNGLVCISDQFGEATCIWNPCTRQFKFLPRTKLVCAYVTLYLGFGFDYVGKDYKILRVERKRETPGLDSNDEPEVKLYSENAQSWKMIQVPNIKKSFLHGLEEICGSDHINGVLYLEGEGGLLPFDLRNEVFGEIVLFPFPTEVQHERAGVSFAKRLKKSKILDYEGSVAMVYESKADESVLSLWTLNDVCGSWTKKFNLETDVKLNRVYLYLGAEQYVGLNYVLGYKFYNYRKKTTKELPFPAQFTDVESVAKFTQSIVSLDGFELQDYTPELKWII